MIAEIESTITKWEGSTHSLLDSKHQILQLLRNETHKIVQLAFLWSTKTEMAVEKLFAEDFKELIETFGACRTLKNALKQQTLSEQEESKPEQQLRERVEYMRKLVDRGTLRRQSENTFIINPVNQVTAFTYFDKLTGVCSEVEEKRPPVMTEMVKLKNTKVHGKFFIATKTSRNLRISDVDLCDGVLVVSDVMNSCIYVYNSWTGRQVTSTHDNPFQHGVQFPKQVIIVSTGQICVIEQLKDAVIRSIFQNKLSNKRMISKSSFMDDKQLSSHEIIGFEHLSEASVNRYRSQTKEDRELFTPPSKDDIVIDLIKTKNAEIRLQNLTERKDYILAVNFHRNKVFYVDKTNNSFWATSLAPECGPRKATRSLNGEILVCCAKSVHIHMLSSEGNVLQMISLEKTHIRRPIAIHQRDANHFIVTEEQGTCTTLTFCWDI